MPTPRAILENDSAAAAENMPPAEAPGNAEVRQDSLSPRDIVETIKILVRLQDGRGDIDDIDHLGNRRVRSSANWPKTSSAPAWCVERAIRSACPRPDRQPLMPHDLINAKPISAAIKEFFGSSSSQFMDQTNPLSGNHPQAASRPSGPGGLTRNAPVFEVRDVHPPTTAASARSKRRKGRTSASSARWPATRGQQVRFHRDPLPQKVKDGKPTKRDRPYLSAMEEAKLRHRPGQCLPRRERHLADELVTCRERRAQLIPAEGPRFMDVSPKQVSGRRGAHPVPRDDDANRAPDGLEHAAPGRAAASTDAPWWHRHEAGRARLWRRHRAPRWRGGD